MPDHAVSSSPAVQRQLDRLWSLSPGADILGLERITTLLERLGNPHERMPPAFHVAGTNGKGSTCAYLRAALEAAGHKVHVYTSPHLVRFNERIRLAGQLIDDATLAALLEEVLDIAGDVNASFFEVTTAAAFLAFARVPADACVIEVGLGGRLDATNVLPHPLACGIAQLGLDHQAFLGNRIEDIAGEKAGIAKPGAPLLTLHYPARVANRIGQVAHAAGANWLQRGANWQSSAIGGKLHYQDHGGELELPLPRLPGAHQAVNAGLAIAMLRHQSSVSVPVSALRAAMGWAEWPARLQRLTVGTLPPIVAGSELWLDGGHNPAASRAIAQYFRRRLPPGGGFHIILGMLANKDLPGFLEPFAGSGAVIHPVDVPGHAAHDAEVIRAAGEGAGLIVRPATTPCAALESIAALPEADRPHSILIGGSLYLCGEVLAENGTPPV